MEKKLVKKFFMNQTLSEETKQVLEWFDTPEDKQCLQERLGIDYDLMDRKELREMFRNWIPIGCIHPKINYT